MHKHSVTKINTVGSRLQENGLHLAIIVVGVVTVMIGFDGWFGAKSNEASPRGTESTRSEILAIGQALADEPLSVESPSQGDVAEAAEVSESALVSEGGGNNSNEWNSFERDLRRLSDPIRMGLENRERMQEQNSKDRFVDSSNLYEVDPLSGLASEDEIRAAVEEKVGGDVDWVEVDALEQNVTAFLELMDAELLPEDTSDLFHAEVESSIEIIRAEVEAILEESGNSSLVDLDDPELGEMVNSILLGSARNTEAMNFVFSGRTQTEQVPVGTR